MSERVGDEALTARVDQAGAELRDSMNEAAQDLGLAKTLVEPELNAAYDAMLAEFALTMRSCGHSLPILEGVLDGTRKEPVQPPILARHHGQAGLFCAPCGDAMWSALFRGPCAVCGEASVAAAMAQHHIFLMLAPTCRKHTAAEAV